LDNSTEEDTVYVFNGTYFENLNVKTNSIKLYGEDKNITIIDGMGIDNVINVTAFYVNICGFTIQHGDVGIFSVSSHSEYHDNIITNNLEGIELFINQQNNKNTFKPESNNNIIYRNIIKNNNIGISIAAETNIIPLLEGRSNKISNNIIYNNKYIGIVIYSCANIISRNQISYNGYEGQGYEGEGGIIISYFSNKILSNNLTNNKCGVTIELGLNNIVKKNNFINNDKNAYFMFVEIRKPNQWSRNYWDDWGGLGPKIIYGDVIHFDYSGGYNFTQARNYDWSPARKQYEITFTNNIDGFGIEQRKY
jgi:parallel beta-helix repeat protein